MTTEKFWALLKSQPFVDAMVQNEGAGVTIQVLTTDHQNRTKVIYDTRQAVEVLGTHDLTAFAQTLFTEEGETFHSTSYCAAQIENEDGTRFRVQWSPQRVGGDNGIAKLIQPYLIVRWLPALGKTA